MKDDLVDRVEHAEEERPRFGRVIKHRGENTAGILHPFGMVRRRLAAADQIVGDIGIALRMGGILHDIVHLARSVVHAKKGHGIAISSG